MFISNAPFVRVEFEFLRSLPNWSNRWSEAIAEVAVGHPIPFIFYPKSSGNLIHQAYHLAQFKQHTGVVAHRIDLVFEFGGGYGAMCRLFHNLGFRGRYVIFDLAPFSALQEYYLKATGLEVHPATSFAEKQSGVFCVSDSKELRRVFSPSGAWEDLETAFLATWSLSEAPIEARDPIIALISGFDSVLAAYQGEFGGVDNCQFFMDFRRNFTGMSWYNWEIEHLPGHYYLMANKVDRSSNSAGGLQ